MKIKNKPHLENPKVIYEDEAILVLDKPVGWVVNESETSFQNTIQNWLITSHQTAISSNRLLRSGIVHRIDKETSGILLVAKDEKSFENLQKQFKDRVVEKSYKALVHGVVSEDDGTINEPVGRLPWKRNRFGVLLGGRDALTNYKVLKRFDDFTLLSLTPKTGRTHQLRIHLKHIKHPIVGDLFYAGRKVGKSDRMWCPRMFLHAAGISFIHPVTGEKVSFESELSKELHIVLARLG